MQDESRTSIKISQPRVAQSRTVQSQSSNRRMDFAPVHASSRVISPLPTDRDLERRRIAKQEMQRREAIRQQIEEQNRLKNLNQRRIEAARQELSEYQAVEEQRNRALEAERQRAIESQRVAQKEALAQMAARRKAMEQEAYRRQIEEKNRKLRAMQEMQRQKEASKINVSRRISVAPVQTSPFKENAETQSPVSPRSSSASLHSSISSLHPSAASHSSVATPLRPAGATKVLPASRIQVVASPNRKLFGRIRPAGPSRQVPQDEQDPLVQSARNSRIELSAPGASTTSDSDLEDILYDAFEDSTSDTPERLSAKSRNQSQNSEPIQDTSENNMNYILGGRSPFINTDKIVKRPLSESRKDDSKISASFDTSSMLKNNEESLTPKARKNVYAKREHTKKATKKGTMIVEDRPKGVGISLAIAITFMIILGTVVGALVYFAFFQ